jgi:hypothetical protein
MNSNSFFTVELRSKSTTFFHHPFLNLSLISRFLYRDTLARKPREKFGAKDCEGVQGGTVAQSHITHKASGSSGGNLLLSYSQVEAQVEAIHRVHFMRYHNIS